VYKPEWDGDNRYEQHQLTLVQILTTLCTSARNDFLLYDGKLDRIIKWTNGMALMKNCYCNRKLPVDRAALLVLRDAYLVQNRFFYDPSRCIARNHQFTGDYDVKYQKANHLEESAKWKLRLGKADDFAHSPLIDSDEQLKKKRAVQAAKARLETLAVTNGSGNNVVTKKPKAKPVAVSSPALVPVNKSSSVIASSSTALVIPKNLPQSGMRIDTPTGLPKSNFIALQAIVQEADLIEERIKQESRLRLIAMQEKAKLDMESAKEKAKVVEDALKQEAQRILAEQRNAKEQAILDTQNHGILLHAIC
jgi:hypothetical protein